MDKEQIKAIARSIWNIRREDEDRCDMEIEDLRESHSVFKEAEAAIESYKAELLKEVGEPIYQVCKSDSISLSSAWIDVTEQTYNDAGLYPEYGRRILYTSDQVAAAILKATKPLEDQLAAAQEEIKRLKDSVEFWESYSKAKLGDQLAKAEQRVAEACALTYLEDYDMTDIADRVRDGEWRKFVKEV